MHRSKGFTLIEVLVASLILFLVITTMMSVYRGALLSSNKANHTLVFSTKILQLKTVITENLRKTSSLSSQSGNGRLDTLDYEWIAEPQVTGLGFHPENFPIDMVIATGTNSPQGSTPLHLWKINITLYNNNQQRQYEFWELTW